MTKEQEESIDYVQKQIDYFKKQIKFIEAVDRTYYESEYRLYKNRVKQFETVLNMLKEKDTEIEKKDNAVRKIIKRLNNDIERTTKIKSDGKHCDDYSRCRLKAYKTKTKEIKEYIEEQYFERKSEE